MRWTPLRKAAVLDTIRSGEIDADEAEPKTGEA